MAHLLYIEHFAQQLAPAWARHQAEIQVWHLREINDGGVHEQERLAQSLKFKKGVERELDLEESDRSNKEKLLYSELKTRI